MRDYLTKTFQNIFHCIGEAYDRYVGQGAISVFDLSTQPAGNDRYMIVPFVAFGYCAVY